MSPDTPIVSHGVDFSGGKRHRRKIRVATREPGRPATVRAGFSHGDLVELIASSTRDERHHGWLIDTPFGLPVEMLDEQGVDRGWLEAVEWLAGFEDAREWRRACRRRSRKERRRRTDTLARTPFAPVNLRMFRQTWHGLVDVLRPLARTPGIALLPLDTRPASEAGDDVPAAWSDARVRVGEGCPATILRDAGWEARGYKGSEDVHRARREEILARLVSDLAVDLDPETAAAAVEDTDGDVLDSLLLLPAAERLAGEEPARVADREPVAVVEGWVWR